MLNLVEKKPSKNFSFIKENTDKKNWNKSQNYATEEHFLKLIESRIYFS